MPRPLLVEVHQAAGGNPFYAQEIVRTLQRTGASVEAGSPLPVPDSLHQLVHERVLALPPESRGRLRIPIAHGEGNYYAPQETVASLEAAGQVVFRYVTDAGAPTPAGNPNGSVNNIAGICNARRNVVGLMPHPERACEPIVGSADGRILFESVIESLARRGSLEAATR